MILLDTNVISELMKRQPHPAVERFIAERPVQALFLPSLVIAEIRYGIERLPAGRRQDSIERAFETFLISGFAGRILVFDAACAASYARVRAMRERAGRPIALQDALIGGMAIAFGATLATRNTADFDDYGLTIVNPWLKDLAG